MLIDFKVNEFMQAWLLATFHLGFSSFLDHGSIGFESLVSECHDGVTPDLVVARGFEPIKLLDKFSFVGELLVTRYDPVKNEVHETTDSHGGTKFQEELSPNSVSCFCTYSGYNGFSFTFLFFDWLNFTQCFSLNFV